MNWLKESVVGSGWRVVGGQVCGGWGVGPAGVRSAISLPPRGPTLLEAADRNNLRLT